MRLHRFLRRFSPETRIRVLEENGTVLDENVVGDIPQRLMNCRSVLTACVEGEQLIVVTARDEE